MWSSDGLAGNRFDCTETPMKSLSLIAGLLLSPLLPLPLVLATPALAAATLSDLGDLSAMRAIVQNTAGLVNKGDLAGAVVRITDWETAWDQAQPTLRTKNKKEWRFVDDASDAALSALRAKPQVLANINATLTALLAALDNPGQ